MPGTSANLTSELFDPKEGYRPLADRMRPTTLAEFAGQTHLLSCDQPLRLAIEQGRLHSMIFWGLLVQERPHWRVSFQVPRGHSSFQYLPCWLE